MRNGYITKINEKATNGEVIKSLFPNIGITSNEVDPIIHGWINESHSIEVQFIINEEWWNAPYKREGK